LIFFEFNKDILSKGVHFRSNERLKEKEKSSAKKEKEKHFRSSL
jgi:hypothetical protein